MKKILFLLLITFSVYSQNEPIKAPSLIIRSVNNSAGTYDFLTKNTSTGVVEKVASNTIAPIASSTLTGTPTAPTATAGTNTTQIVTTAFLQLFRQQIHLKYFKEN